MKRLQLARFLLAVIGAAVLVVPVEAANLVQNGSFDSDVSDWTVVMPAVSTLVWDPLDAGGSPTSGSGLGTNAAVVASGSCFFDQCVGGVLPGHGYDLAAAILYEGGQVTTGSAFVVLYWYSSSSCTGSVGVDSTPTVHSSTPDTWVASATPDLFAPAGAHSAVVRLYMTKTEDHDTLAAYFDNVFLGPAASAIFGDGFEGGDTASWSVAVP